MAYYVYIIQSLKDGVYYKGSSENPLQRLEQHNLGLSTYTSSRVPWKLVYVEELPSKRDMIIRERNLKRGHASYFEALIRSDKNMLNKLP